MIKLFGRKNHKKALRQALGDYELPTFPALAMRVLECIRSEDACAASVAEALALDPGLSVRVLATVNSAAYALCQRVENLTQAVAMLGMSNLESLVLAVAVGDALPRPECAGFDAQRFWLGAARRAATARALAMRLEPAKRTESFTAALLQDMAVPLLAASRPAEYGQILEGWQAGLADLVELERPALSFDHAEAGTWLCAQWKLPESLNAAVGGHHCAPGSAPGCPLAVALVGPLRESDSVAEATERLAARCPRLGVEELGEIVQESFAAAEDFVALLG